MSSRREESHCESPGGRERIISGGKERAPHNLLPLDCVPADIHTHTYTSCFMASGSGAGQGFVAPDGTLLQPQAYAQGAAPLVSTIQSVKYVRAMPGTGFI